MATIKRFEDIIAWQETRDFCKWVWTVIETTALKDNYKLRDQLDSSSGSIMDNIAEGFERSGRKEFIQMLGFAKGSAGECRSQLYRLLDRSFIQQDAFEFRYKQLNEISSMINGFIQYLMGSDKRGWKFMEPEMQYGIPEED